MRACVCPRYGPPELLRVDERPRPVPAAGELLVRVHATTVSAADHRIRALDMPRGFGSIARLVFGLTRPRQPVLGSEFAGVVAAVGAGVTRFKLGDAVFAFTGARLGAHAEYACIAETAAVARKPAGLDFGEAAALSFGGTTALDFLRRAKLARGERVLVVGATGAVGSAAVQLARHQGARVTAVCSTANVALALELGAERVIDYSRDDFAASSDTYDVILDATGSAPYSRCRRVLAGGGRLLAVAADLPQMLAAPWARLTRGHRVIAGPAPERAGDLRELAALAESGVFRPVIDRRFPFERIADAHRYVDTGRKRGNVVITLVPDPTASRPASSRPAASEGVQQ